MGNWLFLKKNFWGKRESTSGEMFALPTATLAPHTIHWATPAEITKTKVSFEHRLGVAQMKKLNKENDCWASAIIQRLRYLPCTQQTLFQFQHSHMVPWDLHLWFLRGEQGVRTEKGFLNCQNACFHPQQLMVPVHANSLTKLFLSTPYNCDYLLEKNKL